MNKKKDLEKLKEICRKYDLTPPPEIQEEETKEFVASHPLVLKAKRLIGGDNGDKILVNIKKLELKFEMIFCWNMIEVTNFNE